MRASEASGAGMMRGGRGCERAMRRALLCLQQMIGDAFEQVALGACEAQLVVTTVDLERRDRQLFQLQQAETKKAAHAEMGCETNTQRKPHRATPSSSAVHCI